MIKMEKNECAKTRGVDEPYEIYQAGDWEWRVLKKYQSPKQERKNPYARWLCAVKSPYTGDVYDVGDTYVREVVTIGIKMNPDEVESHCRQNRWGKP